jgi:hypothetical protein
MKPKLIDYKSLNNDMKLKTLNDTLSKSIDKLQQNMDTSSIKQIQPIKQSNIKTQLNHNINNYRPFYKKTSILFNLILGIIIISFPFFLYYRYKNRESKLEKDKKILDVVSNINNKLGLNPDYIKDFQNNNLKNLNKLK